MSEREIQSLETLGDEVAALPAEESQIIADVIDDCEKLDRKKYDL